MPPPNRLARPLTNSLAYSVPVPLEPGMMRPAPAAFNPRRELENLSIGLGRGAVTGMEGTKQLLTQPVATAQALIEAARQLGTDPAVILDMLRAARQRAMSGSLGLGELIGENVTPGMRGRRVPVIRELDVYHGTPHRFPATETNPLGEFDASKIGTGEGAQAYGHGIYYAENPDVAKGYQSSLSADRGFSFEGKTGLTRAEVQDMVNAKYGKGYLDNILRPSGVADSFIDDMVTGVTRAEGAYPKQYKPGSERAKLYDELRGKITHASPGSLYKADLPDEMIDRMLDWDKPLSKDAPQAVKDAFNKLAQTYPDLKEKLFAAYREGQPGSHYYSLLNDYAKTGDLVKNQTFASDAMRQAGIPGIKYLDAGSRGQGGSGTRNFVVFPGEEKKVRILERK